MTVPKLLTRDVRRANSIPSSARVVRRDLSTIRPDTVVKLHGSFGLGDTLYLRSIVDLWAATREPSTTYVHTPWPQLWQGSPVRLIRSGTHFRTQLVNEQRNLHLYVDTEPMTARRIAMGYSSADFEEGRTVTEALAARLGFHLPDKMDHAFTVPDAWKWKPETDRPVAFVRPPTIRKEWRAPGRNPDPAAFAALVNHLMQTHHVVSVAHVQKNEEWIVDPIPAHTRYEAGELSIEQVLGLLASADIALGGVGFIVPALGTTNTRGFILAGGVLRANEARILLDQRFDWSNVQFAYPDAGSRCCCTKYEHACVKTTDPARVVAELESFIQERKI